VSTTVSVESASPSPGVHPIAPPTSCQLKPSTMAKGAKYKASDESTAAEAAADAALAASEETLKHGAEAAAEVSEKAEGLLSKIGSAAKAVAREVAMIDDTPSKKKNPFSGKKAEGETEAEANEEVDPEAAEAAATLQATLEASASMKAKRAAWMMTPEEKQAAETEAKAQEIQIASEYEELMSDRLPGVNPKLDFNEAKDRWKEAAVTDINGQYISVCGSGYNDLEPLGPGIGLWFRTLKSLALYFTLMTLLVGLVIYNFIYLYYNPESDMDEDTMGALARVTAGVMATTDQTDSIGGIDIRTIMLVVVSIDVFCILCFLIMIAHLKRRQDRYVEENDDAVVSLPDYSVMVWGIPTDATEEQLVAHFSKFGQLADVVLVKDLGRVMAPRMRRATQLDYLKDLKIDAAAMTLKHRVRALKVIFPKSQHCLPPLVQFTTAVTFTGNCHNYIHHKCSVCSYSTPIDSRLTLFFYTRRCKRDASSGTKSAWRRRTIKSERRLKKDSRRCARSSRSRNRNRGRCASTRTTNNGAAATPRR
jgi:hypothetical protein